MSFDDGTLRILSLSKAAYDVPVTGRPFVGTQHQGLHSYFCSSYPIWSVQASRLTGQVVYCSADGSVLHFQLTSKAVDKDPSRNRAPHFLCGSLTEEDGGLTLNAPLPDIPLPIKKPLKECGDRSIYGLLADSNQVKRANDQTPDREPLDLIYDGDPSFQIGSGDTATAPESKTTSKKSNKRIPDKELIQVDNFQKGDNQEQSQTEFETISPKIVAMHRVRWNMNKGSERWLCYGGAAGIIQCQEISVSSTGGCSLVKK
ncbi:General transcription factor 3c polypeptide [Thalictrum thalictroides]|uniref:General transcription factor 3c polypeptide n=1 Tax=Thalictrum thalictroides TaxID=46969 RepID=A0A7J6X6Q2_THATH|nr:General transcription factor 3c polypeptide [Thalictrum thalictroides]